MGGQVVKQVELYCQGARGGEATLRADGTRVEICARMRDPGDGLYRAVLEGERFELPLGVMESKDGELVLRRRPERSEIERMGMVRRVRVARSFAFGEKRIWQRTEEPSQLFRDDFWRQRLKNQPYAWWRRERNVLALALPLKEDAPFPLEVLFCFARVERVENELCVVYTFDENEMPLCKATESLPK